MINPFQKVKNHTNYTDEEILELLSKAKYRYEYDYLIDRLYLYSTDNTRNTCNKFEYSFLTARQMLNRQKIESGHLDV